MPRRIDVNLYLVSILLVVLSLMMLMTLSDPSIAAAQSTDERSRQRTRQPSPTPTLEATPSPSPTPVARWLGVVAERRRTTDGVPTIIVQVQEVEGAPIQLRPANGQLGGDRRCLTGEAAPGLDSCQFTDLTPGNYIVALEGLNLSLPVAVPADETVRVKFSQELLPAGVTGWQVRINENSNQSTAFAQSDGTITVQIAGRAGQVVALRSVRGTEKFCETVFNPLLEGLYCEFAGLPPGVYAVEALNTGASQRIFIDGAGQASLIFAPGVVSPASARIFGRGSRPDLPTATPSATATATATNTPIPIAQATRRPTATATITATPTITPTATPAFAWQARILERVPGVGGTIGVRAAGLEGHPVVIRSGGWSTPVQLTGAKPELGQFGAEFGGLAGGEYVIELIDLAEIKVQLNGGEYMLVEFKYDWVDPPVADR